MLKHHFVKKFQLIIIKKVEEFAQRKIYKLIEKKIKIKLKIFLFEFLNINSIQTIILLNSKHDYVSKKTFRQFTKTHTQQF